MSDQGHYRRRFLKAAGCSVIVPAALSALPLGTLQALAAQTKQSQAEITPDKALQLLKEGNARFAAAKLRERDLLQEVKSTAGGQFPFAAVVGCVDSRVSNELIFDQGIGDIFSVRIAGNFVNDDMLGSLEFACAASGARLIVVLGHTQCGAIKGACDDVVIGNLTQTLSNLKPAVAAVTGFDDNRTSKNDAFVQAVAEKNVELTVERIRQRSVILQKMADRGDIAIAGAMYAIETGVVTFA